MCRRANWLIGLTVAGSRFCFSARVSASQRSDGSEKVLLFVDVNGARIGRGLVTLSSSARSGKLEYLVGSSSCLLPCIWYSSKRARASGSRSTESKSAGMKSSSCCEATDFVGGCTRRELILRAWSAVNPLRTVGRCSICDSALSNISDIIGYQMSVDSKFCRPLASRGLVIARAGLDGQGIFRKVFGS